MLVVQWEIGRVIGKECRSAAGGREALTGLAQAHSNWGTGVPQCDKCRETKKRRAWGSASRGILKVGGHNSCVHREVEGRQTQVGSSTGRLKEGGHRLVWCTGRLGGSYLCCL